MRPPNLWNIALSAWIIQDGNYADFAMGDIAEFAVEYYREPDAEISPCDLEPCAHLLHDSVYGVVAERVLQTGDMTVLNIGILVYRETESAEVLGESAVRFQTHMNLGVDPFFYFERLNKTQGAPPLIYSWRIASILRQTAPLIETVATTGWLSGRTVLIRDPSKLGYEAIEKTNAWADDNGRAEYVLRCELLPIDPKFMSATAIEP